MKTITGNSKLIILYCLLLITACKPEELAKVTKLNTGEIIQKTHNSATVSGEIIDLSGNVTSYGHCWNTTGNPAILDEKYIVNATAKKGEYFSYLTNLSGSTKYFIRAYAQDGNQVIYGNEINFTTNESPYITITSPAGTDHWVGNEVHTINWNDNIDENVTIALYKNNVFTREIVGSPGVLSNGTYSWTLPTDLEYGTDYSIKIFSVTDNMINGQSTEFEIIMPLSDYDGNVYKLVKIGTQWWMKENLKTTHLSGGQAIPNITYHEDWRNLITMAYCWFQNTEDPNKDKYGALYNFYFSDFTQNICPSGWHLPSVSDWNILIDFLTNNGYGYEGSGNDIAKSIASTTEWLENSTPGTVGNSLSSNNSSGFNALPSGFRYGDDASFWGLTRTANWWSSTSDDTGAYAFLIESTSSWLENYKENKRSGYSIRCVRDLY